jgi:hypothetical protein
MPIRCFVLPQSFLIRCLFLVQVQRKSVIMDALLYIYKLKLKLEAIKRELANLVAIKREYLSLMKQLQLPKVTSLSLPLVISFFTVLFFTLTIRDIVDLFSEGGQGREG